MRRTDALAMMTSTYTIENDGLSDKIRILKDKKLMSKQELMYKEFLEIQDNLRLKGSYRNRDDWFFAGLFNKDQQWQLVSDGYIITRQYLVRGPGTDYACCHFIFKPGFHEDFTLESSKIFRECCESKCPYSMYRVTMGIKDPHSPIATEKFYNAIKATYTK